MTRNVTEREQCLVCGRGTAGPGRGVAAGPAREPLPPAQSGLRRKPAALQGRPLWRVPPWKTRFPESWQSTAQAAVSPFGEGPGSGGPARVPPQPVTLSPRPPPAQRFCSRGCMELLIMSSFIRSLNIY